MLEISEKLKAKIEKISNSKMDLGTFGTAIAHLMYYVESTSNLLGFDPGLIAVLTYLELLLQYANDIHEKGEDITIKQFYADVAEKVTEENKKQKNKFKDLIDGHLKSFEKEIKERIYDEKLASVVNDVKN